MQHIVPLIVVAIIALAIVGFVFRKNKKVAAADAVVAKVADTALVDAEKGVLAAEKAAQANANPQP